MGLLFWFVNRKIFFILLFVDVFLKDSIKIMTIFGIFKSDYFDNRPAINT